MFYCVTLLCVFVLTNNAIANTSSIDREPDDNNDIVKEWHSGGGFVNAGDSYLNGTALDDDSEDDVDDKHEQSKITLGSRIMKGYIQENLSHSPWVACIVKVKKLPLKTLFGCGCSGVIIGRRHVLTAAHCVRACPKDICKLRSKRYYVVVGHARPRETKRFEKVKTFHFIRKPPGTTKPRVSQKRCFSNDLVVLELQEPIKFGHDVQSIPLPPPASLDSKFGATVTTRLIKRKRFCQAYGWGAGGGTAVGLKQVFSRLIKCDYPGYESVTTCPRTKICTHQYEEIGSPCGGDSGGPLVCDGVLHGIVAGVWGKCFESNRHIYQRVEVFVPWIRSVMGYLV